MGDRCLRSNIRRFLCHDGVHRVGKDLLSNGQVYYLASIAMTILQIVVTCRTEFKSALSIPAIALENMMTCRVHRAVILGLITNASGTTSPPLMLTSYAVNSDLTSDLTNHDFDAKAGLRPAGDCTNSLSNPV